VLAEIRCGAANRAPAVFDQPVRLDFTRGNAKSHLASGPGPYMCIGNQLARGEEGYVSMSSFVACCMTTLWSAFDRR